MGGKLSQKAIMVLLEIYINFVCSVTEALFQIRLNSRRSLNVLQYKTP